MMDTDEELRRSGRPSGPRPARPGVIWKTMSASRRARDGSIRPNFGNRDRRRWADCDLMAEQRRADERLHQMQQPPEPEQPWWQED